MRTRFQTKNIIVPAATPAGATVEFRIDLDRLYRRTTGWVLFVNNNGGAAYLRVGLKDDTRTIMEVTNAEFIRATSSNNKGARFTAVYAKVDGQQLTIQVQVPPTGLTADANLDFVFSLDDSSEPTV